MFCVCFMIITQEMCYATMHIHVCQSELFLTVTIYYVLYIYLLYNLKKTVTPGIISSSNH